MIILGIDTTAVSAGAAVVKDGMLISETYVNTGLTHSQTLMTLIDMVLKLVDLTVDDVDAFAVSAGPGSFTGVRIGVSTIKGLCFAKNKPCFSVSTLEALANSVDLEGYIICPVMDARCMQVYTALFEKQGEDIVRLMDDSPKTLAELQEIISDFDKKIMFVGDGADLSYRFMSEKELNVTKFSEIFKFQHASGVAITAYRNYNRGTEYISADKLLPSYLRLSQAERELKKSGENKK